MILKNSIVINDINENRIDIDNDNLFLLKKHREAKNATLQAIFKVSSKLELYYNRAF